MSSESGLGGSERQIGVMEQLDFHNKGSANLTAKESVPAGNLTRRSSRSRGVRHQIPKCIKNFLSVMRRLN